MFVHKNQLEYQLRPVHYTSAEQYRREVERLFQPAWHPIAVAAEMPKSGDFVTRELLGQPVLVRNYDGEYHAFLNVCAHRHCLLTSECSGNSPTIRCQYHGWEFDKTGNTGRIPDAGCFRPFDRENARLHKFRTARCGEVIFVSLDNRGPDLREFLGPVYDQIEHRFSNRWRLIWQWDKQFNCNWKIPVENTLETYHLQCLHQESLRDIYPSEPPQKHVLSDRYSSLEYDAFEDEKRLAKFEAHLVRRLGGDSTGKYMHFHVHPGFVFTATDIYLHVQLYQPTSPTTCASRIWYFGLRGRNWGPWARIVSRLVGWGGRRINRRIQTEDASVFEAVQQGLESTRSKGCIGTREERIYAFHKYLLEATEHPELEDSQVEQVRVRSI